VVINSQMSCRGHSLALGSLLVFLYFRDVCVFRGRRIQYVACDKSERHSKHDTSGQTSTICRAKIKKNKKRRTQLFALVPFCCSLLLSFKESKIRIMPFAMYACGSVAWLASRNSLSASHDSPLCSWREITRSGCPCVSVRRPKG
jgi:hypothetical protein